jgi:hypothetical protein
MGNSEQIVYRNFPKELREKSTEDVRIIFDLSTATWLSSRHPDGLIWRARAVRILDLRLFFSKLVSTSS